MDKLLYEMVVIIPHPLIRLLQPCDVSKGGKLYHVIFFILKFLNSKKRMPRMRFYVKIFKLIQDLTLVYIGAVLVKL